MRIFCIYNNSFSISTSQFKQFVINSDIHLKLVPLIVYSHNVTMQIKLDFEIFLVDRICICQNTIIMAVRRIWYLWKTISKRATLRRGIIITYSGRALFNRFPHRNNVDPW